jgi:hypothetical protein
MGQRYWVGGLGVWTDLVHWSLTSGGAGGASVPGPDDDVFIDSNSFSSPGQYILFPAAVGMALFIPDIPAISVDLTKIEEEPVSGGLALGIPDAPTISAIVNGWNPVGTCTVSVAHPCVVTKTGHGLINNQEVMFLTTGTLPNEVIKGVSYYVKYLDANTFNLMVIPDGFVLDTNGVSTGTHTLYEVA